MQDIQQSFIEQLDKWIDGNPEHNKITGECCPDFSCCNKFPVEISKENKIAFKEAYI